MSAHVLPVTLTLTACLAGAPAPGASAADDKLTHDEALAALLAAGVGWSSTSGCADRDNPECTSFEQINASAVAGVSALAAVSGCEITITGGTEAGHATNAHSHWDGHRLDLRKNACLDDHITGGFDNAGPRADGYPRWRAPAGDLYCDEGTHWDVLYY